MSDHKEIDGERDVNIEKLPPRMLKHSGKKGRFSRIYSIILLWIFAILIVSLIVWGYQTHA